MQDGVWTACRRSHGGEQTGRLPRGGLVLPRDDHAVVEPGQTQIPRRGPGGRPGPTILLRGDMDALPMPEDTGLDYEEWIYGQPPQDVDFVRIVGDEVVRVETMKVGGQKIVRTEKEVILAKPKEEEATDDKKPKK